MSLQVSIAHTGQKLQADPTSFASLDAFKTWVAQNSNISVQNHIGLTGQGKPVKLQSLPAEKSIFVYDRRIINPSSANSANALKVEIALPPKYNASKPPDTISDQSDMGAWVELFRERRSWALKLVGDCANMATEAQVRYSEIQVITLGVDAAVVNLEKHVKTLDHKNADMQSWAAEIQQEQETNGTDFEASMARLRSLPSSSEVIKFIVGHEPQSQRKPTLAELISMDEVKDAGKHVRSISASFNHNIKEAGAKVDEIMNRIDQLFDKVEKGTSRSAIRRAQEPAQLLEDIEAIAKKVKDDYDTVLNYPCGSKYVLQASKSALLHTKNFLPNLSKRAREMDDLWRNATELRNLVATDALDAMRDVARLTGMVGEATTAFAALALNDDAIDAYHLLTIANALPVSYASFLAEAIRRREWAEKVRSDTSTLANEMATFQDEESKRRRKWQKSVGANFWGDRAEGRVVGLEVSLRGEEVEWPQVSRQDLDDHLETLQSQSPRYGLVSDIVKIVSELNNPTKQQSKRAKAFKAGSMHEATLGRSTLLTRGDDELIRVLQEDKQKTESKLKTAESRVRRLEDLLHRQSQVSRQSTGTIFGNAFSPSGIPSPDPQSANPLASPRMTEDASRRSSVSSRRFSATQGPEEKVFQQRLLSLEAELIAEREKSAGLQKEVSVRKTTAVSMKTQVDEANSTKRDLMENFDAQQREFIDERKSLEDEIKHLKADLEEQQDEMDKYLGSHENEKANVDDRVRGLQDELEKVHQDADAEIQKALGQVDFLRNDAKLQRETNETLERLLQRVKDHNRELLARAEQAEETAKTQMKALVNVHEQLSPKLKVPDDLKHLTSNVVALSGDLVSELSSVKSDAAIARDDRDTAQGSLSELKSETERTKQMLFAEEVETAHLRETLAEERAKFVALETELIDERGQLSILRSKISDGETGSEALRTRLEEEEEQVTRLSEDLAAQQTRVGGLEEELRSLHDKYEANQRKLETLSSRFEARTSRAKDLTQRVYAQNDRLCRLLERLSYSVTREGNSMVIQRIPRPERTNANDSSDPGSAIKRSISGAIARKAMVDSGDLELLYWMHNDDSETESEKYNSYMNAIGSFDVEQFCEVITKRIKDMEYTSRKYSKDARAYRDKSHIAQKEAHEKIAFKSFKDGDLALFLPTRNQSAGAWAAFNVGAPHYFLREQESHKLRSRDWLLARIHKIEDRIVDLSKSISSTQVNVSDGRSFGETSNGGDSFEDDNPFDLSDGLRWYLVDAAEEKPGAPSTPGLSKSTVASAHIDATGSIRRSKKSSSSGVEGLNKTLSKSLDSRRNSNNSKRSIPVGNPLVRTGSTTTMGSLKATATTQTAGEGSEAQLIIASNRQDGSGSRNGNKVLSSENIAPNTPVGKSPVKKPMIWDSLLATSYTLGK